MLFVEAGAQKPNEAPRRVHVVTPHRLISRQDVPGRVPIRVRHIVSGTRAPETMKLSPADGPRLGNILRTSIEIVVTATLSTPQGLRGEWPS